MTVSICLSSLYRRLYYKQLKKHPLVKSAHAVAIQSLPPLHKDPFDRILVAQATEEGITLLTSDAMVAQYPGPILPV